MATRALKAKYGANAIETYRAAVRLLRSTAIAATNEEHTHVDPLVEKANLFRECYGDKAYHEAVSGLQARDHDAYYVFLCLKAGKSRPTVILELSAKYRDVQARGDEAPDVVRPARTNFGTYSRVISDAFAPAS